VFKVFVSLIIIIILVIYIALFLALKDAFHRAETNRSKLNGKTRSKRNKHTEHFMEKGKNCRSYAGCVLEGRVQGSAGEGSLKRWVLRVA